MSYFFLCLPLRNLSIKKIKEKKLTFVSGKVGKQIFKARFEKSLYQGTYLFEQQLYTVPTYMSNNYT